MAAAVDDLVVVRRVGQTNRLFHGIGIEPARKVRANRRGLVLKQVLKTTVVTIADIMESIVEKPMMHCKS
jgi:hypothetical protein